MIQRGSGFNSTRNFGFGGQVQWPFQCDQNNLLRFLEFVEFLAEEEKELQACKITSQLSVRAFSS